jgi:hypothetical protein
MDRRAVFFFVAAIVCAILIPVTEAGQRWVPIFLSVTYLLLSVASWADRRTRVATAADEERRISQMMEGGVS